MNKTHVRVLRHTRQYIASGREFYICDALTHTMDKYPSYRRAVLDLKGYINQQLDGYCTLDTWLQANHPEKMRNSMGSLVKYPTDEYRDHMKATRLAWIDYMIAEFERNEK